MVTIVGQGPLPRLALHVTPDGFENSTRLRPLHNASEWLRAGNGGDTHAWAEGSDDGGDSYDRDGYDGDGLWRGGRSNRARQPVAYVEAEYQGGNNTRELQFAYRVQEGDAAGYLDAANSSALVAPFASLVFLEANSELREAPGGGGVYDGAGQGAYAALPPNFPEGAFRVRPMALRLPVWPARASLAESCRARVDGSAPRVLRVDFGADPGAVGSGPSGVWSSGPGGGPSGETGSLRDPRGVDVFTAGESVLVRVHFSAPVAVARATLWLDVLGGGNVHGTGRGQARGGRLGRGHPVRAWSLDGSARVLIFR